MALTATANEQVMADVVARLGLRSCVTLTQSFNRPNLHYQVRKKGKDVLADMSTFIKSHHYQECGVIYCLSRNKCEEVAKDLRQKHGLSAEHYHAQMTTPEKTRTQSAWQEGEVHIIVATVRLKLLKYRVRLIEVGIQRLRLAWASIKPTSASSFTIRCQCR